MPTAVPSAWQVGLFKWPFVIVEAVKLLLWAICPQAWGKKDKGKKKQSRNIVLKWRERKEKKGDRKGEAGEEEEWFKKRGGGALPSLQMAVQESISCAQYNAKLWNAISDMSVWHMITWAGGEESYILKSRIVPADFIKHGWGLHCLWWS